MNTRFRHYLKLSLPLLAFACMGNSNDVFASCGDYLYKRGQEPAEMPSAMEEHKESGECKDHQPTPIPIAPLPVNPLPQNDHFVQTVQSDADANATQRQNQSNRNSEVRRGYRMRIDRPPQR